jgi:hypothetical protein
MPNGRCNGCPKIHGRAKLCEADGTVQDFDITGDPDNWRGTRFHLSPRSITERNSGSGPGELQGEWAGDEMHATGVWNSYARVATASASRSSQPTSPPQIQYTLRRGAETDFLAACRATVATK